MTSVFDTTGDAAVPAYDVTEIAPKRTPYCCCVFVLNEGARIRRQLERMRPLADSVDIVIADGGSTDGALATDVLREAHVRALLVKRGPGQLSAQMRMAFAWAMQSGYEGVITIDGNDKDDPSALPSFVKALNDGFDHIQGSRFMPGGRAINTPLLRSVAVRALHAPLISWAAGTRYTDTTNGFRGYSRRLLTDARVAPLRDVFAGYELHYYLAIRAARLGYRVTELPVTRAYPSKGPTPTKISGVRGYVLILRTLWRACFSGYDPPATVTVPKEHS
jgi:dolichol-phosphate mannosyltransferase